jgi:cytochrome P450
MSAGRTWGDTIGTAGQQCPHLTMDTQEFADTFYESVAECQRESPLIWDDTLGSWVVISAQTLADVAKDWQTYSSAYGVASPGVPLLLPMDADPPKHTRWRSLLNGFFTMRAMEERVPGMRGVSARLLDPIVARGVDGRGAADFVQEFTTPLPGQVFFEQILQLSDDELHRCNHLVEMAMDYRRPEHQLEGYAGIFQYSADVVERVRAGAGASPLLTAIVKAEFDGQLAPAEEAASVISMLIFGGLETTTNTLGGILLHLANDPQLQKQLRADRSLLPTAIEEFLRLYSPTIRLTRKAVADAELEGYRIAAGQRVGLSFAAAGRDPAAHEDPHSFRLDREHYRHATFGLGIHRCLGSNLARMMLRVAVEDVLDRLGDLRPADGFEPRFRPGGVRALFALELTYDALPA